MQLHINTKRNTIILKRRIFKHIETITDHSDKYMYNDLRQTIIYANSDYSSVCLTDLLNQCNVNDVEQYEWYVFW